MLDTTPPPLRRLLALLALAGLAAGCPPIEPLSWDRVLASRTAGGGIELKMEASWTEDYPETSGRDSVCATLFLLSGGEETASAEACAPMGGTRTATLAVALQGPLDPEGELRIEGDEGLRVQRPIQQLPEPGTPLVLLGLP